MKNNEKENQKKNDKFKWNEIKIEQKRTYCQHKYIKLKLQGGKNETVW